MGRRSLRVGVEDPLRLDTVFTLASMNKLLTALCALQLFERGALALDADVSQHVPVLARQRILTGLPCLPASIIDGSWSIRAWTEYCGKSSTEL